MLLQKFQSAPHTPTDSQGRVHKIVILTVVPHIFVQNVYLMCIKTSCKFYRIPDTQSCVITKVYNLMGQPS